MGLKVLSALDSAKTQWYHFKAIIIAGMGLFTDAYDLFCIPPIMRLLGRVYYDDSVPPAVASSMVAVALMGTVTGQLVFGRLGDLMGRRRVYGLVLGLMVASSVGCGFSVCTTRGCVIGSLGFFRFVLGVGIGGDYPLSATIMSEFANKRTRGSFIAAVFSMQGIGIVASSAVTMLICTIFEATNWPVDIAWRLILILGAVPAALTYYWRMMMPETARYTALVERNVAQAAKDMEKVLEVSISELLAASEGTGEEEEEEEEPHRYSLFSREFVTRHGRDLMACSATWFLVDIVFYSSNLFQSHVYQVDKQGTTSAYREAYNVARLQAVIAACSTIPGYWFTVYFIERVGRVPIQMGGFLCMGVVYFCIGVTYYSYWNWDTPNADRRDGFMVLYALTFFFANFGPNTTTFIVPAELFPARFRSTCHGISGAAGKIGAIIGSVGFLWASHNKEEDGYPKAIGMTASLVILGGVCVAGMAVTYLFTVETKGRSLEENEEHIPHPFILRPVPWPASTAISSTTTHNHI